MFSFLNPLFLWAAAAAVVPLVLHMLQRRRVVRVPFSTLRFLKAAEARSSRRMRLEQFLLWLMRTVLVLLLVGAFAMPMLRTSSLGAFLGAARRDVAVVLDASYSMEYSTGRERVWDRAVDAAAAIVQSLEEGDRVAVFLAADGPRPVVEQLSADRRFVTAQIKARAPEPGTSRLCPAVAAAYQALAGETRRREREVHILTDGQALAWNSFAAGAEHGWAPDKIESRTAFFVTLLGVPEPRNAAPVAIELQPPVLTPAAPWRVLTRLSRTGPAAPGTLSLFVDEREVSRQAAGGEGAGDEVVFQAAPLPAGIHACRVELSADSLGADNGFHFLARSREQLAVLCVGTEQSTFFLRKALGVKAAGGGAAIETSLVAPDALNAAKLAACACVFLCDALPLPAQAVLELEQFVRQGGALALFPGERAAARDYEAWSCLPALPAGVEDIPAEQRTRVLVWDKPQDDLLSGLKPGSEGGVLTLQRALRWDRFQEGGAPLVSAGAGTPFILGRRVGNGRVFAFAVPADRSWSSLPLSPWFLPLVHQIALLGAGAGGARPYLWATHSVPLSEYLPAADETTGLLNPRGIRLPVRRAVVENRATLLAEGLEEPGIYRLAGAEGGAGEPVLAVNMDRAESALAPLKPEEIAVRTGLRGVRVAAGRDDLLRLVKEHRVGRSLGEAALWAAFLLAVLEAFYANRKSKPVAALSASLGIEASGKVRGAAPAPVAAAQEGPA